MPIIVSYFKTCNSSVVTLSIESNVKPGS